jgi:anti-sigma factor ChrR (cupin superfamily)
MRTLSCVVIAMTLVLGPFLASVIGAEDHMMVTPNDLKWADIPSLPPGAKIAVIEGPMDQATPFTFRVQLPADYKIPAHWHPAIEHVTVISGTFNMGTGD